VSLYLFILFFKVHFEEPVLLHSNLSSVPQSNACLD
jgi:hypothetical protein